MSHKKYPGDLLLLGVMLPRFLALGIIGDYYYEKNWNTSDENI
jgi:hypothetical protein